MYKPRHKSSKPGYWKRTLKNKLYALALLALGVIPILIEGDATLLVLAAFIAIPMFLSRKNWIV